MYVQSVNIQDSATQLIWNITIINGQFEITQIVGVTPTVVNIADDNPAQGIWQLGISNGQLMLTSVVVGGVLPMIFIKDQTTGNYWQLKVLNGQYYIGLITPTIIVPNPNLLIKHYVGEVGTELLIDCQIDVSGAVNTYLSVKRPDGTIVTWDCVPYTLGTCPNYLRHTFDTGDLPISGVYQIQPYVQIAGEFDGFGLTTPLTIYDLFA